MFEAHLEVQKGSGKNRRWVTVFRGAIITMGYGKSFHGTTLLQRANKHKSWFGLGGQKDSVKFDGHELANVDLVHPEFEDRFAVWSDDQVEARYLIETPFDVAHACEVRAQGIEPRQQRGAALHQMRLGLGAGHRLGGGGIDIVQIRLRPYR